MESLSNSNEPIKKTAQEAADALTEALASKQPAEGIPEVTRLIELFPTVSELYITKAQLLIEVGRNREAIRFLESAAARTDFTPQGNRSVEELLLTTLVSIGEFEIAIERLREKTEKDSNKIDSIKQLSNLLITWGHADLAIIELKKVIASNPTLSKMGNDTHVNNTAVNILWSLKKSLVDLQAELDRIKFPLSPEMGAGEEKLRLAIKDAAMGRFMVATRDIRYVVSQFPNRAEPALALSLTLYWWGSLLGDKSKLIESFQSALKVAELFSNWAEAYYYAGRALVPVFGDETKSISKIERCFKKAIELDACHLDAHLELGAIYQMHGRMTEAYFHYKRVKEIERIRYNNHPLARQGIRLISETHTYAIGHMGEHLDCYLKMQDLGWETKTKSIILAHPGMTGNKALLDYWSQYFEVITDEEEILKLRPLMKDLEYNPSFVLLPDDRGMNSIIGWSVIQDEWNKQGKGPLLKLSRTHKEQGWKILEEYGMSRDSWFVALHVREGGYKQEGSNCPYNGHRNADIMSYLPAIKWITEQGGWVVRLGESSVKPLPKISRVIDYALTPHKSDWMDIFLSTQCKFFFGATSGIRTVPQVFGTPVVGSNYSLTPLLCHHTDIFTHKLFKLKKENRLLTFKELLSEPYFHALSGHFQKFLDIEYIDNTPDDILDTVKEMYGRLQGTPQYTDEDERLQERYRKLLNPKFGKFISRIGRDFLRKNQHLMGD